MVEKGRGLVYNKARLNPDRSGRGANSLAKENDHATRTISIVMVITLIGKVLGLYRDHLMAVHYGTAGMEAKAFYVASRIPRVFFDVVFASAIAACFIPVFSEYLTQKGKQEAFRFGGNFLSVMTLLTALLTGLGILFAEPLVTLFADGYDAQTAALAASLTRVMFPTVLFTGVAFSFVGILQAMDRFNIPALISTVSNLVIIGYFYFLDEDYGVYGLAAAYLAGWLLQALVQVPSLKQIGFRYHPNFSFRTDGMRRAFALMGPVMVSTWVQPINLTINSRFGSHLYDGAGGVRHGVFHQSVPGDRWGVYPVHHQRDLSQAVPAHRPAPGGGLPGHPAPDGSTGACFLSSPWRRGSCSWPGPWCPSCMEAGSLTNFPCPSPPRPWCGSHWGWWATAFRIF